MTTLCRFCEANDLTSCQNYPSHIGDYCPVGWKPEPEGCDCCGEAPAAEGSKQCLACDEIALALKTLASVTAIISKHSYTTTGRSALSVHGETILSSAVLELTLIRNRVEAGEAAAFQIAAE